MVAEVALAAGLSPGASGTANWGTSLLLTFSVVWKPFIRMRPCRLASMSGLCPSAAGAEAPSSSSHAHRVDALRTGR